MAQQSLFESQRLTFERLTSTHVSDRYLEWLNDPDIREGLVSTDLHDPYTIEDLRAYVASLPDDGWAFAVMLDGRHVGNVRVHGLDAHGIAQIGYLIGDKALWGSGIGSEAVARVSEYALNELGIRKLVAGCFGDNPGSARLLEKCGFTKEAHHRQHYRRGDQYLDVRFYARFSEEEA